MLVVEFLLLTVVAAVCIQTALLLKAVYSGAQKYKGLGMLAMNGEQVALGYGLQLCLLIRLRLLTKIW
jgi:hypothetical protein